jgi:hypothetical protein
MSTSGSWGIETVNSLFQRIKTEEKQRKIEIPREKRAQTNYGEVSKRKLDVLIPSLASLNSLLTLRTETRFLKRNG